MLAACNSSGRESSRVPIDYTLVKNIKKPNGARPGMVIYETYYTMLTTPDHAAAQKLLETTELSISAIAEQTGFASAAHFRRVFREVMDISPLQYRKKQTK